jgi:hypothetical protein
MLSSVVTYKDLCVGKGAIPCTQPLERQNREYHTVIPMAASHEAMLHTNLFNLLKNIAWKNSETVIQYKLSKIALVQYQAAAALVRANIKPVFVGAYHGEDGHNFHVWYLNATAGGKKVRGDLWFIFSCYRLRCTK